MLLKAVLSLAFVLGLLMLTLWAIKYCQIYSSQNCFMRKLSAEQRLNIIETRKLDAKNTLVLLKKDNVEHLLLLGASQNILVESVSLKPSTLKKGEK